MTDTPRIMAYMPTLARPQLAAQAVRMFELQTYPNKELVVVDCANQIPEVSGDGWRVVRLERYGPHPSHCGVVTNWGIRLSDAPYICRWDDDDQYFPWHLEACVDALNKGMWAMPSHTWDAYETGWELSCTTRPNGTDHAYAGSWCFRREAFEAIKGYPENQFREGEQRVALKMFSTYGQAVNTLTERLPDPSYVYMRHRPDAVHYGHVPEAEVRRIHHAQHPQVATFTPVWPQNYMRNIPINAQPVPRKF